jgi:hypothetical protein
MHLSECQITEVQFPPSTVHGTSTNANTNINTNTSSGSSSASGSVPALIMTSRPQWDETPNYPLEPRPRANAFSTDGGATFGPAVAVPALPMLARGMQGQVVGVPGYGVLASLVWAGDAYNESAGIAPRQNLTIKQSMDGGHTWKHAVNVWPGGAGYHAMQNLGDGKVGIMCGACVVPSVRSCDPIRTVLSCVE